MHWSSVSDSPATPLLPEPLFKKYWYEEYGRSGWVDYAIMIHAAKTFGCSAQGYKVKNVNEVIRKNRAGKNDKCLTKKELIENFTCESPEEFMQWSKARDIAFQEMVEDFGPNEEKPLDKKK